MKFLKAFSLLVIIVLISCSSDDDNAVTTPMVQNIEATISSSQLATIQTLPDGSDITSFIDFGDGGPASEFTTEAIIGDDITYDIKIADANTNFFYEGFAFNSGDNTLLDALEPVFKANVPGAQPGEEMIYGFKVKENAREGQEMKFDIEVSIVTNGIKGSNVYVIDPKIKIRRSR